MFSVQAAAAIDSTAPIVKLRTSCLEAGKTLNNCFTTMGALTSWIGNTRKPTATEPLLVEIGPGLFDGFEAPSSVPACHITLRGAGRQRTYIGNDTNYSMLFAPTCNLDVQDLTVRGNFPLGLVNVNSVGASCASAGTCGRTNWTNVDLIGMTYGWTESATSGAQHYWFNSRILVNGGGSIARGYSSGSESWFFGTEITAIAPEGSSIGEVFSIGLDSGAKAHVYGGVIRAIAEMGVNLPDAGHGLSGKVVKGMLALSVGQGAELHIHGAGIDVISAEANDISVYGAHPGAHIHANEVAYNLSTGTGGRITRIISNGGHVHAPYLWEQHAEPPVVVSEHGADIAVVTNTADSQPHLVIYSTNCASSWFDAVTGACR